MKQTFFVVLLALALSCVMTSSGTPNEVADEIVVMLDAGDVTGAERLLDRASRRGATAGKLYPLLYQSASERFGNADSPGAARILRLMVSRYESATAVREALLLCLFIERAKQAEPDKSIGDEIQTLLGELEQLPASTSPWLDLIATQQAIDRGSLEEAHIRLNRFRQAWDGKPESLLIYVEDMERYLESH